MSSGAMRGMRILVSNQHLPGYTSETVERDPRPGVLEVRDVFDPAGRLIGQISYETRRVNRGTLYGWTAVGTGRNGFLDDKLDAIRKLIAEDAENRASKPKRSKVLLSSLEPGDFFAFHPNDKTCVYLGTRGAQHRSQGCTLTGERIHGLTYLSDDQTVHLRQPKPAVEAAAVSS